MRVHHVELDVDGDLTEVAELNGLARPDLVLLNDDDLAYAKIRLDDALATARRSRTSPQIERPARALARVGCGVGSDAGCRDLARPTTSISCCATSASETESTTVRTRSPAAARGELVRRARATRRGARRVADGLWALAQEAEAGSDASSSS